jgi:hypothetical protein
MHVLGLAISVVGVVMLISLLVLHVRCYGRFVRHLEANHRDHWNSIGSPVQFEDEPQYGSIGYAKYFSTRRYAELGDADLSALGDRVRNMRKWNFVSLAVIVFGTSIASGDIG